ncbi:PREDICTED: putative nuclease HARBI1 [Ipomoea nil]|uniref:putative nuclease HARBI1 n=1 Tax=Ipomoea nil TaxID=35883 RepID=UPI000901D86E|nr:PREDICTED: putative nuclease HARBI1 [Ipomoea nil]
MDDTLLNLINLRREAIENEAASSRRRRRPRRVIERNCEEADQRLYNDYFSNSPTYTDDLFRQRFRMRRNLFLRIVEGVTNYDQYFQSTIDSTGRRSFSPLQKCTAAMCMLAYRSSADSIDENIRMGETTIMRCIKRFVQSINDVFGEEYLRRPNVVDVQRLMQIGEQRGFPGMLGSIDCMHWELRSCPTAWHGQYVRGDHGYPTIILEAVASADLWIWHAFFGLAGTLNDINVLDRSPIFHEVLEGKAPQVNFVVNGNHYNLGYYLADGIYPSWETFAKSIPLAQSAKHKLFAKKQEAARKDIERAFGVLKARFAIISNPARMGSKETLGQIMRACIIIHNMIVEDERDSYAIDSNYTNESVNCNVSTPENSPSHFIRNEDYIRNHAMIRNRPTNHQLREDLIEEIWNRFGGDEN